MMVFEEIVINCPGLAHEFHMVFEDFHCLLSQPIYSNNILNGILTSYVVIQITRNTLANRLQILLGARYSKAENVEKLNRKWTELLD